MWKCLTVFISFRNREVICVDLYSISLVFKMQIHLPHWCQHPIGFCLSLSPFFLFFFKSYTYTWLSDFRHSGVTEEVLILSLGWWKEAAHTCPGASRYPHVPWYQQVPKLISKPRGRILAPQLCFPGRALTKCYFQSNTAFVFWLYDQASHRHLPISG